MPQFFEANQNVNLDCVELPLFLKPDIGQGSKGAIKINSIEELNYHNKRNSEIVNCEYLPGKEFTVNCFTDYKGNLRVFNMRNRIRINFGISVNSKILKLDNEVYEIANIINKKLRLRGA